MVWAFFDASDVPIRVIAPAEALKLVLVSILAALNPNNSHAFSS